MPLSHVLLWRHNTPLERQAGVVEEGLAGYASKLMILSLPLTAGLGMVLRENWTIVFRFVCTPPPGFSL
jgi:hypothetical protein